MYKRQVATTIAGPPISVVGFLCQRSAFGFATRPARRAPYRATGVKTTEKRMPRPSVRRIRAGSDSDTIVFGHAVDDLGNARDVTHGSNAGIIAKEWRACLEWGRQV